MEHEVAMVKASILYADHVTIVSPVVGRLAMMAAASVASKNGDDKSVLRYVESIRRSTGINGTDERIDLETARSLAVSFGEQVAEALRTDPFWAELRPCINAKLLTVEPFAGGPPVEALAQLLHILDEGHASQPGWLALVDETVGRILEVGKTVGLPPLKGVSGSSEIALAQHVIDRIPAFPEAPMDVLLDVRKDLKKPLAKFRGAIVDYSKDITATPATREFEREADALYREKVAPKLEELNDLGDQIKAWPALRREIAESSGGRVLSSSATLVVTSALGLPAVLQAGIAAATVAIDVAGATLKRIRETRDDQALNEVYWLYEAGRRLRSP